MSRSWCKVSASLDSHPKIRRAGNLGRQVFEFALRRNAEIDGVGVIPRHHLDPDCNHSRLCRGIRSHVFRARQSR